MKHALIAAMVMLSGQALASPYDDYVACLVGKSAVALHSQATKDASTAQEAAYAACPEPADADDQEMEGLLDYVNLMVERMATE